VIYQCAGCGCEAEGPRVVFTTEATDGRGVDVSVAKRWVTCPTCADEVFTRIGMPSPFAEADGRTLAFPDDAPVGAQAGGFTGPRLA